MRKDKKNIKIFTIYVFGKRIICIFALDFKNQLKKQNYESNYSVRLSKDVSVRRCPSGQLTT